MASNLLTKDMIYGNTGFDTLRQLRGESIENRLKEAQAKEQEGRANYFMSRANEYQPPKQPLDEINYLQGILQQYPRGTPQNMWAARALGNMVLQGSPIMGQPGHPGRGGAPGAGAGGGAGMMIDPESGELIVNPESGKRSGVQFSRQNADGTWTTYTTPATGATTAGQKRKSAHEESMALYDQWAKGVKPYSGFNGALTLAKDKLDAGLGRATQEQMIRLENYAQAQKIRPELAKNIDRFASGGETSVEGTNAIKNSALGMNWLSPQSVAQAAMEEYPIIQTNAFNQSLQPEAQDYPVNSNSAPVYADPGFGQQPQDWYQIADAYQKSQQPRNAPRQTAPAISPNNPFSDLVPR